jgi:hypothetical protein
VVLIRPTLLPSARAGVHPAVRGNPVPEWGTSCIDCPKDYFEIGDRGLGLDGGGHLPLAYAGDYLYCARQHDTGWRVEMVAGAPGSEGLYTSSAFLALDGSDVPHLSLYDTANAVLKYAHRKGGNWAIEVADDAGWKFCYDSALALDGADRPCIAYAVDGQPAYARWTGSTWEIPVVDKARWFGGFRSLVLDGADRLHISYPDRGSGVRYGRWTGES